MPDPAWSTIFMVLILAINLVGVRYVQFSALKHDAWIFSRVMADIDCMVKSNTGSHLSKF